MMKKDFNQQYNQKENSRSEKEKRNNMIKKLYDDLDMLFLRLNTLDGMESEENIVDISNCHIVIALSGGPDSIFLAELVYNYLLNRHDIPKEDICNILSSVHINHNLRETAKDDEDLAKKFCKDRNIQFLSYSEDVIGISKRDNVSIEKAGRNIRYERLFSYAKSLRKDKKRVYILTAHNADDNAETIFLRLMRGTSKKGLLGIKRVQKVSEEIFLLRPIIEVYKKDILKYIEDNNIQYAIDETNFGTEYTRNKVRNIIFKEIESYGFDISKSLNNLSYELEDEERYIEKVVDKKQEEAIIYIGVNNNSDNYGNNNEGIEEVVYDLDILLKNDRYIICRIIAKTLEDMIYIDDNISRVNIYDIYELIENNINGKKLYPKKELEVSIRRKKEYIKDCNDNSKVVVFIRL